MHLCIRKAFITPQYQYLKHHKTNVNCKIKSIKKEDI